MSNEPKPAGGLLDPDRREVLRVAGSVASGGMAGALAMSSRAFA